MKVTYAHYPWYNTPTFFLIQNKGYHSYCTSIHTCAHAHIHTQPIFTDVYDFLHPSLLTPPPK